MKLISIDPSMRGTGIAYWLDGQLIDTDLYSSTQRSRRGWGFVAREQSDKLHDDDAVNWPTDIVCEIPQIYKQSPGDPNDLVAVAMVAGGLVSAFNCKHVTTVWPAEWKGQVPKEAHHPRIMRALQGTELHVVEDAKRKTGAAFHNVMDAVGLGLWYLRKHGVR